MVPGLTLGILTTGVVTGGPAVVVVARPVQGTLAVVDTLASGAPDQGVSSVPGWTGADWPVSPGPVEPGLALGTGSAGVWITQVLLLERSAADKGVASVSSGTRADGFVVGGFAGRPIAAHVGVGLVAGILALQSDAGFVGGAVSVSGALCVAPGIRVPEEVWRTAALSSVVDGLTVCVLSTSSPGAGILTPVQEAVTLL